MNFRNNIALLSTAALGTLLLAGTPQTAQANNQIASYQNQTPQQTDVTFTGGIGGVLQTAAGGITVNATSPSGVNTAAVFSFGPITQIGPASVSNGQISAAFSGGSFSLVAAASPFTPLLTGTFTGSTLTTNGSSGSAINMGFNSVTFTGGTYRQEFLNIYNGGAPGNVIGNLSISLSSMNPAPVTIIAGGGISAFSSPSSVGTFDAAVAAVPEPGEWAAMGMAGMSVMGLMVRARRKASASKSVVAA